MERLQDFEDEVRAAAIEGIASAATASLALLDSGFAPLTEVRKTAPCIRSSVHHLRLLLCSRSDWKPPAFAMYC